MADEVILHISHLWNYVFVALTLLNKVGVASSSLYKWLKTWEEEAVLIPSRRGKHAKTLSPIVDPDFRDQFCAHVRSESCAKGCKWLVR